MKNLKIILKIKEKNTLTTPSSSADITISFVKNFVLLIGNLIKINYSWALWIWCANSPWVFINPKERSLDPVANTTINKITLAIRRKSDRTARVFMII